MEAWGAQGLWGLFAVAFLAGSVVPAPSEAALAAAVAAGYPVWLAAAVATFGNLLGAVSIFAFTRQVAGPDGARVEAFLAKKSGRDRARVEKALNRVRRWGGPALLLSWVPIVGDPIVAAAGLLRVGWGPFFLFAATGKAARYAVVAMGAAAVAGRLG